MALLLQILLATRLCAGRDFIVGGRGWWTTNPAEPFNHWDEAERHLRRRRTPLATAAAARGLAAVRSGREILARHRRMTSPDGARLQARSVAWCSSVARSGESMDSRNDRALLKLLRAKLFWPLELQAKLGRGTNQSSTHRSNSSLAKSSTPCISLS